MATITVSGNSGSTLGGVEDNQLDGNAPNTNLEFINPIYTGVNGSNLTVIAIRFPLPSGSGTVSNSKIRFYLIDKSGSRTALSAYQILRNDWVATESTYNIYKTSNNWTTAGIQGAGTDRGSTAVASVDVASASLNTYIEFTGSGLDALLQSLINSSATEVSFVIQYTDTTLTATPYIGVRGTGGADGEMPELVYDLTAGGGYTLDANAGSFALAGQQATLLKSRVLDSNAGAFALAGQQASLNRNRNLAANAGSFALAGQSVDIFKSKSIIAVEGSFTLAGQQAELVYTPNAAAYTLDANAGAFALTGQQATLLKSYVLDANAGSFSLSGQQAELARGRVLNANAGSFSLSGQDATLLKSNVIDANAGAFDLIGRSATITWSGEDPPIAVDAQVVSLLTYSKLGAK